MRNFRKMSVVAAALCIAVSYCIFAQDDLDDLLKDLESEAPKAQEAGAKADEKAEAKAGEAAKEEEKAEAPAAEEKPAVVEAAKEEEPAPAAEEKPAVAEEAKAEAVEKPAEDVAAAEEKKAEEKKKNDDILNLLDNLAKEGEEDGDKAVEAPAAAEPAAKTEEVAAAEDAPAAPAADEAPAPSEKPVAEKPVAKAVAKPSAENPDAELLANIVEVEKQRRVAYDAQAIREVDAARKAMLAEEYADAIRHYSMALQFLNDAPKSKTYRVECEQGIAEGLFRYAMQEDKIGRRERAVKLMDKAVDWRHPKARRQLEMWLRADDPDAYKTDITEITHRINDEKYKEKRFEQRKHLRRSRQFLAAHELADALFECEVVLKNDPNNEEALHLRDAIQKKREVILGQERKIARKGMINDVDEKWRPVYAPNARQLEEVEAKTVKKPIGGDSERSPEQVLIKRMKDMILPTVEFKPPATISDAVDFFRDAARDYDNPETPIEKRGFGMYLRTPKPMFAQAADDGGDNNDFSDEGNDASEESAKHGLPMIPNISVNNISFYEALKLVCDSVGYKFRVQGSIVIVMDKSMTIDEMVTRSYPVLASFLTKMNDAAGEIRTMQAAGAFGGQNARGKDNGEENQERDWKEFFRMMGVDWPEGSSIFYLQTLGKLRVKNTRDNLIDFEDALNELNVDQRLIEIETRFVEVCQDDLNSLGFEWLLNADYTLGVSRKIGKILGLRNGKWGENGYTWNRTDSSKSHYDQTIGTGDIANGGKTYNETTTWDDAANASQSEITGGAGNRWARGNPEFDRYNNFRRNMGVSSINGTDYSNGERYLSTVGNHISGEAKSTNDQFMRVNAFLGNADLSMILHMLSQRSDTDLLSSPKVLTRPGEEAIIKVVTEYIYPTDYDVQLSSSSSSGGYNSRSSGNSSVLAIVEPQSFAMREVGVILDVTPTLTDDGNLIDLDLDTQVVDEPTWKNYGMKIPYSGNSSLSSFEGIGEIFSGLASIFTVLGTAISDEIKSAMAVQASDTAMTAMNNLSSSDGNMTYYDVPMEQPFFHVRSINSKVSVYPGATIVMGGLITEARKAMDDKIPFLGDIPFIGRFFRSHSEFTSKRNLLIFVTTRLVDTRGREVEVDATKDKPAGEVKAAPETAAAE